MALGPSQRHPPKFLYFDLGNVLLHFDHGLACSRLAAETGVERERVRQIIFDTDLGVRYDRGEITSHEFFELLCRAAEARHTPDLDRLMLAASAIFEVNQEILPLLSRLREANWRLGVLSNTCEAHWQYCFAGRYAFLNRLFQVYALSFELKAAKPEPAIYAAAARLAGCEPAEIFFVDDRTDNVAGAVEAGFDAVLFTTVRALRQALLERGVQ
jgi:putative hydrolase of the HAD superfamily